MWFAVQAAVGRRGALVTATGACPRRCVRRKEPVRKKARALAVSWNPAGASRKAIGPAANRWIALHVAPGAVLFAS